jgi:hypothetical protein
VVLAVILGVLAASSVYVVRYMPFAPANEVTGGGGTDLGRFDPPSGQTFSATRFAYHDGGTFYFGFGLMNTGPLPVRVTGIATDSARGAGSLVKESVWIAKAKGWTGPPGSKGGQRFQSFSLGSGQTRWVVFSERFANCSSHGLSKGGTSKQVLARAEVGYRILGIIPRHAVMPFALEPIVVLSARSSCRH